MQKTATLIPMSRPSTFRLASLRRISSMAAFMLLVFLARVGIGMACEPHEFAELFGNASAPAWVVVDDDYDGDGAADQKSDHCRQCNCHHGVALPTLTASTPIATAVSPIVLFVATPNSAPFERDLRPPIA